MGLLIGQLGGCSRVRIINPDYIVSINLMVNKCKGKETDWRGLVSILGYSCPGAFKNCK
jgi:hypothetical protein